MERKQYDLKLIIDANNVSIVGPSGSTWSYAHDKLPELLYRIMCNSLKSDASLCLSLEKRLKIDDTKPEIYTQK